MPKLLVREWIFRPVDQDVPENGSFAVTMIDGRNLTGCVYDNPWNHGRHELSVRVPLSHGRFKITYVSQSKRIVTLLVSYGKCIIAGVHCRRYQGGGGEGGIYSIRTGMLYGYGTPVETHGQIVLRNV